MSESRAAARPVPRRRAWRGGGARRPVRPTLRVVKTARAEARFEGAHRTADGHGVHGKFGRSPSKLYGAATASAASTPSACWRDYASAPLILSPVGCLAHQIGHADRENSHDRYIDDVRAHDATGLNSWYADALWFRGSPSTPQLRRRSVPHPRAVATTQRRHRSGMAVDLGSGVGGPARYLAAPAAAG